MFLFKNILLKGKGMLQFELCLGNFDALYALYAICPH